MAAPVFLSLQLRDKESLRVEKVPWCFLAGKQRGGMQESCLSLLSLLFLTFQSSLPGSFLTCSRKLGCTTGRWFTPTAGAPRGDQDPPRMSNKNNTLSLWGEWGEEGNSTEMTSEILEFTFAMSILFHCALRRSRNFYRNDHHCQYAKQKLSNFMCRTNIDVVGHKLSW